MTALFGSLITDSGVAAAVSSASNVVLRGNGISSVTFGQSEARVSSALQHLIGRASHPVQNDSADSHCEYDALLTWPKATAWFNRGKFVGYQVTDATVGVVTVATAKGLRVGASLTSARRLYGSSLTSSSEQGGAFFVSTSAGRIDGFLSNNPFYDAVGARVTTIGAGIQGCPAMEP
jgi:hypothetical protein